MGTHQYSISLSVALARRSTAPWDPTARAKQGSVLWAPKEKNVIAYFYVDVKVRRTACIHVLEKI